MSPYDWAEQPATICTDAVIQFHPWLSVNEKIGFMLDLEDIRDLPEQPS